MMEIMNQDNKARVLGAVIVILGILLVLTPMYIFPVCGVGRYAPPPGEPIGHHACHGTLKAVTVLGSVAVLAGLMPLLWPGRKTALTASAAALVIAALAVLFPTVITGLCKMPTMACRLGTLPALITIAVLTALTGAAGLYTSRKPP